jgi:hypothetical protein
MKIISFIERRQKRRRVRRLRELWLWAEDQLKELRTGCWRGFLEILRGTWRLAFRPERVISTPKLA